MSIVGLADLKRETGSSLAEAEVLPDKGVGMSIPSGKPRGRGRETGDSGEGKPSGGVPAEDGMSHLLFLIHLPYITDDAFCQFLADSIKKGGELRWVG